jgi:hypothetical protein
LIFGKAVGEQWFSQREVADNLRLHYSTVSRTLKDRKKSKNETRPPGLLLMQTRLPEIGLQLDEKDDPKELYTLGSRRSGIVP